MPQWVQNSNDHNAPVQAWTFTFFWPVHLYLDMINRLSADGHMETRRVAYMCSLGDCAFPPPNQPSVGTLEVNPDIDGIYRGIRLQEV